MTETVDSSFRPTAVPGAAISGLRHTQYLLLLASLGTVLAFAGFIWDHGWHQTLPFDKFWSPPHILLYSGLSLIILTNLGLFHAPVRESLAGGLMLRIPFLAFRVPAPLLLLAVGSLAAILSGMMDQKWHEALRGGESFYSLPHDSILLGAVVAAFGLRQATVALRARKPGGSEGPAWLRRLEDPEADRWLVPLLASALMVVSLRLVSSFGDTRAWVQTLMADPRLSTDVAGNALRQRYLDLNLLADDTLLAPLMLVLALVTLLAYSRGLAGRRWAATSTAVAFALLLLALEGLVRLGGMNLLWSSPAVYMVVPAALAADLAAPRLRPRPGLAWTLAGAVFAVGHGALYGFNPGGIALAAAGGGLAGLLGRSLTGFVERPTPRSVGLGLLLMVVVVPALLGGLDILVRYGTFYWLL